MLNFFILLIISSINSQSVKSTNGLINISFEDIVNAHLMNGTMNNAYLSYNQYISFISNILKIYPELSNILKVTSIGKTYENNTMPMIILSKDINSLKNNVNNQSSIYFSGMHHGREPVSMMMNLYLLLHIITLPENLLNEILSYTTIYMLPIINIDTYKLNCEEWDRTKNINQCFARKNRHFESKNPRCPKNEYIGIDLNRNYDYQFGVDNVGSSNDYCDETYRGPYPFSEPETQNIKNFLLQIPNLKITINYHTFGNLVITPFNYLNFVESLEIIKKKYQKLFEFYNEFEKEAGYPPNFDFGNAHKTINYRSNGEATDWMIGALNALSFSPELGNGKKNSDKFYPNKSVTFDVLEKNLPSALYTVQKTMYFLKAYYSKNNYYSLCQNELKKRENFQSNKYILYCDNNDIVLFTQIAIKNEGFADFVASKSKIKIGFDLNNIGLIKNVTYWISNKVYMDHLAATKMIYKKIDLINNEKSFLIELDFNISSRKEIYYNFEIVVQNQALFELFQKKDLYEKENNIKNSNIDFLDMKILSLNNNYNYSHKSYLINSEELNYNKEFIWLFNQPKIDIYLNNFTEGSLYNLYKTLRLPTNKNEGLNPITIIIGFFVILLLCMFGYVFYLIRKSYFEYKSSDNVPITSNSDNSHSYNINVSNINKNDNNSKEKTYNVRYAQLEEEKS